jgi:hypothetical protein
MNTRTVHSIRFEAIPALKFWDESSDIWAFFKGMHGLFAVFNLNHPLSPLFGENKVF